MPKSRLWSDTKKTKELFKKEEESRNRGKVDYIKLDKKVNRMAVVPGLDGKSFCKTVVTHEIWSKGKVIHRIACGKNDDRNDCPLCNTFWKLRKKYGDTKDEKTKKIINMFQNRTARYMNVVDVSKTSDYKPKVLNVPMMVYNAFNTELDDYDDINDLIGINKGKILEITTNGRSGIARRYEAVKFRDKAPLLIKKGKIDLKEFEDAVIDLDTFDTNFSMKLAEKLDLKLRNKYLKNIDLENDDEEDDNDDVDENENLDDMVDDDELEDDDDLDNDDNDDDDNDDDELEDDDDLDEDIDIDDDVEEKKETKKKNSKLINKSKNKLRKKNK